MGVLILLRHGHSVWNLENRFTGLADVPLAPAGCDDARRAGHELGGLHIDAAYTSKLQRAINTAHLALDAAGQGDVPIIETAVLNDRNYGDIQGRNRDELTAEFGKPQVDRWRHSYSERPPNGDSIADLADKVVPYFLSEILPRLQAGENILVTGHCDSLRALMVHLEQLNVDDTPYIANGQPIVYTFDDAMRVASKTASQAAHTV